MPRDEDTKPTIYDVAEESGVSIGTVSRVINNRPNVAPATRERVLEAARRIGFVPQHTATRTTIGVIMQDVNEVQRSAYVGNVICELANRAARRGAMLELMHLRDIDHLYERHCQAVIALIFGEATKQLDEVCDLPIVLINNRPSSAHFHTVSTDHAEGALMGTRYLLEKNHRRIVFAQIESNEWGAREREKGYRAALEEAGVPVDERLIVYLEDQSVEKAFDPVLKRKPTAVFACGEDLSLAIAEGLIHRLGLHLPEDISLLSYEVPLTSQMFTPPLTTIAQPWAAMAHAAVDCALAAIRGEHEGTQHISLPNALIERYSVGPLG